MLWFWLALALAFAVGILADSAEVGVGLIFGVIMITLLVKGLKLITALTDWLKRH